jgi:putative ABC transport system permease protein
MNLGSATVITEGERIRSNHQIMLGKWMAENMNKEVGDTIEVSGTRFRIVGIYEAGSGWEEMGGVSTIRDAQNLAGRPRKVTFFGLKLRDPDQAREVIAKINGQFPEAYAALSVSLLISSRHGNPTAFQGYPSWRLSWVALAC